MGKPNYDERRAALGEEHVYYWAWLKDDNPNHRYLSSHNPEWYRVFRCERGRLHDDPITEPMSKQEAVAYCRRIVKLTGGRELV
jgi:hypothetical protein